MELVGFLLVNRVFDGDLIVHVVGDAIRAQDDPFFAVQDAAKGVKDATMMRAFVTAVRQGDSRSPN